MTKDLTSVSSEKIEAKVLLVDYECAGLGEALREILKPPFPLQIQLKYETFGTCLTPDHSDHLSNIILAFDPSLIVLVLAPAVLKRADILFQTLTTKPAHIPIFIAVEPNHLNQLFDLLEFGGVDFTTTPLKPFEIFARIQHLLEEAHQTKQITRTLRGQLKYGWLRNLGYQGIRFMRNCSLRTVVSG